MSSRAEMLAVAERLFVAMEAGDLSMIRSLFVAETRVWHNTDRIEQSREEHLASLAALIGGSHSRTYEIVRREFIHGGFMQQHVLRVESHASETFDVPVCVIGLVEDDHVIRLDYYWDSAQAGAMLDGLTRGLS